MSFGVVYGSMFFLVLAAWLVLFSGGSAWEPLTGLRMFLALLASSLGLGLLLGRRWARWSGAAVGFVTAALVLALSRESAGLSELVLLFGSVAAAVFLAIPATGAVAPSEDPARAPAFGRALGLATTIAAVGLVSTSWLALSRELPPDRPSGRPTAAMPASRAPTRVRWSDFGTGLERARTEDKPVLVTFVTNWCGYCRKMDRTTWKDPSVIERVGELVAVRVDAEDGVERNGYVGRQLASRYRVTGFPTTLMLDQAGKVIASTGGYTAPRELVTWIEGALRRLGGEQPPAGTRRVSGP